MIEDLQDLFSDAQNLAQAAGTYLSDKSKDLQVVGTVPLANSGLTQAGGALPNDPQRGRALSLLCQVVQDFATSAGGTIQVKVVQADDAALTTNLEVLQETVAIAAATAKAGYKFRVGLPIGVTRRFIGLQYVIGTGAMTAGKITAGLVMDQATWGSF
jgi:hypothetical protein